ncbi:MAG: DMT family transporter [Hyphomicrobiaceae bacterium]
MQHTERDLTLGIAFRIAASVMLALMVAAVHAGCSTCEVGQVVMMRGAFALPVIVAYLLFWGEVRAVLTTKRWNGHLVRGAVGGTSLVFTFIAIRSTPMPVATALTFLAPLFATLGAMIFLRETPSARMLGAVVFGFAGVVIIVTAAFDDITYPDITVGGVMAGIAGAVLMAISMLQLKRLSSTESAGCVSFYFSLAITSIGLLLLALGVGPMTWQDVGLGLVAGALGAGAQLAMAESLRRAPISSVAALDYLLLVWVVAIDVFVFDRSPSFFTLTGALVIVVSASLLRQSNGSGGRSRI